MLPTFVVIGVLRGGTTSLSRYLGAHPQVFVASQKEVHFFDKHFDEGLGWYERQFQDAGTARQAGEATPAYLYNDIAMQRLRATLPDAKLIVTLREPVERAYSHYWLLRAQNRTDKDFEQAVREDPTHGWLERGRYLRFLQPLEAEREAGRLHVLLFEDLRDSPAETYAEICRFLDIDDSVLPAVVGRQINAYVAIRSMRVRRWSGRLPKQLRDVVGRVNTSRVPYPSLDPELAADLRAEFEEDNAALADWLGRDLSAWTEQP
ncbi:MAG: hypothetical protein QOD38_1598 [Acidimicrobiaceae bacterium]